MRRTAYRPWRCSRFAVIVLAWLGGTAHGEEWTADDVIRRVKSQDLSVRAALSDVAMARAEQRQWSYPNPSLAWEREALTADSNVVEREDALSLTVPIDLSSQRRTERRLAKSNVASTLADAQNTQTRAVQGALEMFYDVIAEAHRGEIEAAIVDALGVARHVIERRYNEGVASRYDVSRLAIEADLAESSLAQTRHRKHVLAHELGEQLGLDADRDLFTGTLDPALTPPTSTEAANSPAPETVPLYRRAAELAQSAHRSSALGWVPTLSATAGPRFVDGHAADRGYVAGLSLDLPLFSRGQGLRAAAHAAAQHADAMAVAVQRAAHTNAHIAYEEWLLARTQHDRFEELVLTHATQVHDAAQAAYREGHIGVRDLVDAVRARAAAQYQHVEWALAVKHAEVRWQAATGAFE